MTARKNQPVDESSESTGAVLAEATVEYRGRKYNVRFDEDFWTGAVQRQYYADGEKLMSDRNIDVLAAAIVGWDLVEKDGSPKPVTAEAMERTNIYLLAAILNAMIEEVNPNSTTSSQA